LTIDSRATKSAKLGPSPFDDIIPADIQRAIIIPALQLKPNTALPNDISLQKL
tara:strand:- start:3139 stop:3297 length:159 start_codon:yes stop_codon:yes gene_type:complete